MGKSIFKQERDPVLAVVLPRAELLICVEGDDDKAILTEYFAPFCPSHPERSPRELLAFLTPSELDPPTAEDALSAVQVEGTAYKKQQTQSVNGCIRVLRVMEKYFASSPILYALLDGDFLFTKSLTKFTQVLKTLDDQDPEYWRYQEGSGVKMRVYCFPRHEIENFLIEKVVLRHMLESNLPPGDTKRGKFVRKHNLSSSSEEVNTEELMRQYETKVSRMCERIVYAHALEEALKEFQSSAIPRRLKGACDHLNLMNLLQEHHQQDHSPSALKESLAERLRNALCEDAGPVIEAWKRRESHWQQLLMEDDQYSLELMLKLVDGKRLWQHFRERTELVSVRTSDERGHKRSFACLGKKAFSEVEPHAPQVLRRFVQHFLKLAGKKTLEEWYIERMRAA